MTEYAYSVFLTNIYSTDPNEKTNEDKLVESITSQVDAFHFISTKEYAHAKLFSLGLNFGVSNIFNQNIEEDYSYDEFYMDEEAPEYDNTIGFFLEKLSPENSSLLKEGALPERYYNKRYGSMFIVCSIDGQIHHQLSRNFLMKLTGGKTTSRKQSQRKRKQSQRKQSQRKRKQTQRKQTRRR